MTSTVQYCFILTTAIISQLGVTITNKNNNVYLHSQVYASFTTLLLYLLCVENFVA